MSSRTVTTLKVVDFKPFLEGRDKQGVASAIVEAFQTTGFVYLVNHGLPEHKISDMFELSRKLFSLPMEIKQLAPHPESGTHHRGYSAPGREKVKHNQLSDEVAKSQVQSSSAGAAPPNVVRDVKESFEVGREDSLDMPNIWFPDGVFPEFRETCLDFYWTCNETAKEILKALAVGLALPEEYFLPFHSQADNQLRLLHYPSIPASTLADENATRIPTHTDFCTMTFLLQDEIGGLEVEDPTNSGSFLPVVPVPGSLIVNAGDFLMRWSNDTIKSTSHRVRLPPNWEGSDVPDRYSIPYFVGADLSTVVDCIPGTWSLDRPKRYPPISAKGYIMERLALNY